MFKKGNVWPGVCTALVILGMVCGGYYYLKSTSAFNEEEFLQKYYSTGDKAGFFELVVDTIEEGYSYLDYKEATLGFDWQKVAAYYREKLKFVRDDYEYFYYINEMIGLLRDGHTGIGITMSDLFNIPPVEICKDGSIFRIARFVPSMARVYPDLRPGLEIVSIDGVPINQVVDQIIASTGLKFLQKAEEVMIDSFFNYYYVNLFEKKPDICIIRVRDHTGQERDYQFRWTNCLKVQREYHLGKIDKPYDVRLDIGKIGYLKVDSFGGGYGKAVFDQAFKELSGMKGLILDIRHNGGGDISNYGIQVLNHLVGKRQIAYTKQFRISEVMRLTQQRKNYDPRYKGEYGKIDSFYVRPTNRDNYADIPVILLVDETCFSAADIFISAYKDLNVGLIMGRNDLANSGQPGSIEYGNSSLSGSYVLQFSTMVSRSASGEIIEDRMVEPDIIVPLTREEILGEKDVILEKAYEKMNELMAE